MHDARGGAAADQEGRLHGILRIAEGEERRRECQVCLAGALCRRCLLTCFALYRKGSPPTIKVAIKNVGKRQVTLVSGKLARLGTPLIIRSLTETHARLRSRAVGPFPFGRLCRGAQAQERELDLECVLIASCCEQPVDGESLHRCSPTDRGVGEERTGEQGRDHVPRCARRACVLAWLC